MTGPAQWWMDKVRSVGCVVCRRVGRGYVPCEIHHVAEGSGPRSDFAVAGLCAEHHDEARSGSGFHGMGTKRFCDIFKVPGGTEYGLLVWVNQDVASYAGRLL